MKSMWLGWVGLCWLALSAQAGAPSYEIFPFDNGVGRGVWTPEQQADVLRELGYTGIGYNHTHAAEMAQRLRAMEARGIRIRSIYVNSTVGRAQPLPGDLEATLDIFQGRDIVVWLNMASEPKTAPKGSLDDAAAAIVRDVAAMAKARGLRVALYGHKNLYIETAEDGLRVAQKAGCDNVGVTFNLCHELMSGNEKRLPEIIRKVAPHLTLVSINGADLKNKNYIMRLDQGDVDLLGLLRELEKAGYRGPIGLQCYKVPGDVRENLVANMAAWQKLMRAFAAR